jgi:hypothetical protein
MPQLLNPWSNTLWYSCCEKLQAQQIWKRRKNPGSKYPWMATYEP